MCILEKPSKRHKSSTESDSRSPPVSTKHLPPCPNLQFLQLNLFIVSLKMNLLIFLFAKSFTMYEGCCKYQLAHLGLSELRTGVGKIHRLLDFSWKEGSFTENKLSSQTSNLSVCHPSIYLSTYLLPPTYLSILTVQRDDDDEDGNPKPGEEMGLLDDISYSLWQFKWKA